MFNVNKIVQFEFVNNKNKYKKKYASLQNNPLGLNNVVTSLKLK